MKLLFTLFVIILIICLISYNLFLFFQSLEYLNNELVTDNGGIIRITLIVGFVIGTLFAYLVNNV
jgi:hypothetical protein